MRKITALLLCLIFSFSSLGFTYSSNGSLATTPLSSSTVSIDSIAEALENKFNEFKQIDCKIEIGHNEQGQRTVFIRLYMDSIVRGLDTIIKESQAGNPKAKETWTSSLNLLRTTFYNSARNTFNNYGYDDLLYDVRWVKDINDGESAFAIMQWGVTVYDIVNNIDLLNIDNKNQYDSIDDVLNLIDEAFDNQGLKHKLVYEGEDEDGQQVAELLVISDSLIEKVIIPAQEGDESAIDEWDKQMKTLQDYFWLLTTSFIKAGYTKNYVVISLVDSIKQDSPAAQCVRGIINYDFVNQIALFHK